MYLSDEITVPLPTDPNPDVIHQYILATFTDAGFFTTNLSKLGFKDV